MSAEPIASLTGAIEALVQRSPSAPVWVGCSGGMDSSVLLACAAGSALLRSRGVHALHVNHGLHPEADAWADHAAALAAKLDVPMRINRVRVDPRGQGLEAAAREARYRAYQQHLSPGAVLLLAHHQDDQAETVLLRLLRGSALDGVAAMRAWRALGPGWLARPWLDRPRSELLLCARALHLDWSEDPANTDPQHDRSYLRQTIWPNLQARFPQVSMRLARFAGHARAVQTLVDEHTVQRLADLRVNATQEALAIPGLLQLSDLMFGEVLRRHALELGAPAPGYHEIARIRREVIQARGDAEPLLRWRGHAYRRYRERLYLLRWQAWMDAVPELVTWEARWPAGSSALVLPYGLGTLHCRDADGHTQSLPCDLILRFRRGGERIRPSAAQPRRELRLLFQEAGMPGWERAIVPLVYAEGELLAALGLICSEALRQRLGGLQLVHDRANPG